MAFNGSGTFNRIYSWATDAANGLKISSSRMDTEDNGFAAGLSNCITRDGQSPWLANIPAGGFKITGLANGSAPGDSVAYGQLASYAPLAGAAFTGGITGTTASFTGVVTAGAVGGVALQINTNCAIRDVTNGGSTMYFDVSTGGTTHGSWRWRSSNSFTDRMYLDSLGLGIGIVPATALLDVNGTARVRGGLTLDTALAIAQGGTGATSAAAALTALGAQGALTFTSNANGTAIGIKIGATTYYLQFMPVTALGANGSTSLTYPVALGTSVLGAGCTKYVSGPINDGLNLYTAPGLSSLSVVNGGTATSGGYAYVFGY